MSNHLLKYKGELHSNWKGGRHISNGYVLVYSPSHRRAYYGRYMYEHILVYEEYYKCCLLEWSSIHHRNGDRIDNRIENLEAMTRSEHKSLHNIDLEHPRKHVGDTICSECGSNKTGFRQGNPNWYSDGNNGFRCKICYMREYNKGHKQNSII